MKRLMLSEQNLKKTHTTLEVYQLDWSHFVEKVIWALQYKHLRWSSIDISPFSKKEMKAVAEERPLNQGMSGYTV
ncbi:MAG: glutathione S-transferase N-terminal domain-containing protein, partial [Pseudomonadota bacterium]